MSLSFDFILALGEFGQCPCLVENARNVIERPVIHGNPRVFRVIQEFLSLFQAHGSRPMKRHRDEESLRLPL